MHRLLGVELMQYDSWFKKYGIITRYPLNPDAIMKFSLLTVDASMHV